MVHAHEPDHDARQRNHEHQFAEALQPTYHHHWAQRYRGVTPGAVVHQVTSISGDVTDCGRDPRTSAASRRRRCPYRVMPHGLNTDNTIGTSNTTRPPPLWTTSDSRVWPRSVNDPVAWAATFAASPIGPGCSSRTAVATTVITSFTGTQ